MGVRDAVWGARRPLREAGRDDRQIRASGAMPWAPGMSRRPSRPLLLQTLGSPPVLCSSRFDDSVSARVLLCMCHMIQLSSLQG